MTIAQNWTFPPVVRYLLTGILIGFSLSITGQKNGYESGYIITLEGDTLPGLVRDRSAEPFVEMYRRIHFKATKKSKRKFGPEDLLGYAIGNRIYESVPVREDAAFFRFRYYVDPGAEHTFLRVIRRQGPLTWYEQEFVYDDNDYVDSYPLFFREGSPEMVRVTQGVLGLKRDRLSDYFEDCTELVEAIKSKEINEVQQVFRYYQEHCGGESGRASGDGSLLGEWILDLRPAPDAEAYFQSFRVTRTSGNFFEGDFYGSSIEGGRLNRKWGRLYFAFKTRDQNHEYYHSGYLEAGKLYGTSYCPGREFVAPWTGVRD